VGAYSRGTIQANTASTYQMTGILITMRKRSMSRMTARTLTLPLGQHITIRTAEPDDALALSQHINAISAEDVFNVIAPGEHDYTVEEEIARIEAYLAHPTQLLLVVESAGQIWGTVDCTSGTRKRIAHSVNVGISIAARLRNQGVGRLLLSTVLEWATAHPQIEKVTLGVLASNERALHLYTSLGFIEEGRRYRFVKYADGDYVDDILMYRWVK